MVSEPKVTRKLRVGSESGARRKTSDCERVRDPKKTTGHERANTKEKTNEEERAV